MSDQLSNFDKTVECPCCMAIGSLYQTEACCHSHVAKVEDEVDGGVVWKCVSCYSVFTEAFRTHCLKYYFDHEFYFPYYTHCFKICCCDNCRYRNRQECAETKKDYCCPLWAIGQESQDEICGKPNPICPACGDVLFGMDDEFRTWKCCIECEAEFSTEELEEIEAHLPVKPKTDMGYRQIGDPIEYND